MYSCGQKLTYTQHIHESHGTFGLAISAPKLIIPARGKKIRVVSGSTLNWTLTVPHTIVYI